MAHVIGFSEFNQGLCDEVNRLQEENAQLRKRADENFTNYLAEMLAHNQTKAMLEASNMLATQPNWDKITSVLGFDPSQPTYNSLPTVPAPDWAPGFREVFERFVESEDGE